MLQVYIMMFQEHDPAAPRTKTLLVKLTQHELDYLRFKAAKHTGGNVSAWVRLAGLAYVPPKEAPDGEEAAAGEVDPRDV
jgi:hypothetical protein